MSRFWLILSGTASGKALEVTFWVASGILLSLYFGTRLAGEFGREQGIEAFTKARAPESTSPRQNFVTPGPFAWQDYLPTVVPDPLATVPVAQQQMNFPMGSLATVPKSTTASQSMPIALLTIARVGLHVPVFPDTSERNLNRGAGWVAGTAAPDEGGNIAVAAHRDGYFRVLKDVELGDVLVLESYTQETSYLVTELSIVEPNDTSSLLETSTATVTLVTCYPFYFVGHAPQRYIVRAVAQ